MADEGLFEESIAHARDMIRRLEAESGLTASEREALPSYQRVPFKEAGAWQRSVEEKLRSSFGPDTYARYELVWELYRDETERSEGDEDRRVLNVWHRIMTLLEELDARLTMRSSPIGESDIACAECGRGFEPLDIGTGRIQKAGPGPIEYVYFDRTFCPECGLEYRRPQQDDRWPGVRLPWETPGRHKGDPPE